MARTRLSNVVIAPLASGGDNVEQGVVKLNDEFDPVYTYLNEDETFQTDLTTNYNKTVKSADIITKGPLYDPRAYSCVADGTTDATAAFQALVNLVGVAGGGIIDGFGKTFAIESATVEVNYDNVLIVNAKFKRSTTTNGWLFRWATTTNTNGGGMVNVKLQGIATNASGNGGVMFGSATYKANNYIAENIEADSFSQYGVGIEAGDNWKVSNIRVLNHGLTTGTISSCMGFYLFPKIASSGGQLSNVISIISTASKANASANHAAIKLQTHQGLTATNIYGNGGSEECISVDAIQGIVINIIVVPQGGNAGLIVGNYNSAHSFSGQTFTIDGVYCPTRTSSYDIAIGGGEDGQYKLTGCVIRNVDVGNARFLALSNTKNCVFENWVADDIRFSASYNSYTVNSLASTGNTYRNINVRGGASTGVLAIENSNGLISNCGGNAIDSDTIASFEIFGSDNVIASPFSRNCSTNAIVINGSNNELFNVTLKAITGRSIWFKTGSNNNRIHSGDLFAGTGVLDNGTGNYVFGTKREQTGTAAPTSGTWAVGDVVWNSAPNAGGFAGWICTTAGTPGTWKTFGAITP
jgi:hypothetical protein